MADNTAHVSLYSAAGDNLQYMTLTSWQRALPLYFD